MNDLQNSLNIFRVSSGCSSGSKYRHCEDRGSILSPSIVADSCLLLLRHFTSSPLLNAGVQGLQKESPVYCSMNPDLNKNRKGMIFNITKTMQKPIKQIKLFNTSHSTTLRINIVKQLLCSSCVNEVIIVVASVLSAIANRSCRRRR